MNRSLESELHSTHYTDLIPIYCMDDILESTLHPTRTLTHRVAAHHQRETERQQDSETERQRERERQRDRETGEKQRQTETNRDKQRQIETKMGGPQ